MLSEEVLDAMIVVGRQTLSRRVKISSLDSISSGTASITRSASRAACSTEDAYSKRLNACAASSGVTFPSSTALSRLVRISVSALRKVVGRMSSRMVRYPPNAAAWAMPRPMIPAPMTAMVRISAMRLSLGLQFREDGDEIGIGLAHVVAQTLLFLVGKKIQGLLNHNFLFRDLGDRLHHLNRIRTGNVRCDLREIQRDPARVRPVFVRRRRIRPPLL